METGLRIVVVAGTAIVSWVILFYLGFFLQDAGVYGPLFGYYFLTDWQIWQYFILFSSLIITGLAYWLTGLTKSNNG